MLERSHDPESITLCDKIFLFMPLYLFICDFYSLAIWILDFQFLFFNKWVPLYWSQRIHFVFPKSYWLFTFVVARVWWQNWLNSSHSLQWEQILIHWFLNCIWRVSYWCSLLTTVIICFCFCCLIIDFFCGFVFLYNFYLWRGDIIFLFNFFRWWIRYKDGRYLFLIAN